MSISLFDICSLTGLPCIGEEVSALLLTVPVEEYDPGDTRTTFLSFQRNSILATKSKNQDRREHISFLLCLICKFMVCLTGRCVAKEFIPLAVGLAHGKKFALAQFMLGYIYRGCYDVTIFPFGKFSGALWVLQLWLYSYFPTVTLEFEKVDEEDLLTYGMCVQDAKKLPQSFKTYFNYFASLSIDRPNAKFAVFLERKYGPEWYKANRNNEEFKAYWKVYISPRDLFIGCSIGGPQSRCSLELYVPNQFCWQLGYCQAILSPPQFTRHVCFPLSHLHLAIPTALKLIKTGGRHTSHHAFVLDSALEGFLSSHRLQGCTEGLYIHQLEDDFLFSQKTLCLPPMKRLQYLSLEFTSMEEVKIQWEEEGRKIETPYVFQTSLIASERNFYNLWTVDIQYCPNLKDITWIIWAPNLRNLTVYGCHRMEEIIELKSIHRFALSFPRLDVIEIVHCPKLRKIPLSRNSTKRRGIIIRGAKQWWNELEWEDESARDTFLSSFQIW
ncbi:hypothetical protein SLEP1_g43859 [Rubroshorea leprosula]|uniref:Aminotransferase-like plant mobile domain-containing protein n=1 Tax=Rubroshorea leprosula TaxID=152421 RepID=A0AAV5LEX0_9ROSI|nr:hypothetical protein SLEP1_g43859 [Rubroshorea leprosula]